ncbi:TPA: phage tail protein [Vibrio cholerae]
MSTFFTILTKVGEAKLANATALGQTVQFEKLAVGDGNGVLPTPDQNQTALINEVRREPLNSVEIDPNNPNWIICEQIIPEDVGGWTIREVGIYDVDGDLIAVGNFPETYKPILEEGSGRTQTVRIVLQVSSSSSVELKIDPSIVLATREYVDKQDKAHEEKSNPHPQYLLKSGQPNPKIEYTGDLVFTILGDSDNHNEADSVRLDLLADGGEYGMRLGHDGLNANIQYLEVVANRNAERVLEIFPTTDYLTFKREIQVNGANISHACIPRPYPKSTPPNGWFECRGQQFDTDTYPELAKGYPNGWLPDLRGEFIRGLDNGRGVDPNRQALSNQEASVEQHRHRSTMVANPETVSKLLYGADTSTIVPSGKLQDLGSGDPTEGNEHPTYTDYTGGDETRPRNKAFIYIVRAA